MRISAAVDIAAWDIVGKVAGLPLYRLFGGYRSEVPCYVTCAYYRDGKTLAELRDEIQMLKAQGHTGFKAKAGGAPLGEDLERLALVREIIGDDKDLMVDVNRGWDLPTAIEVRRACWNRCGRAGWKSRCGGPMIAGSSSCRAEDEIRAVGGRKRATSYGCRALLEEQAIQLSVRLHDDGGFTEGQNLRRCAS